MTSRSAIDLLAGGSIGRNFKVGGSVFPEAFKSGTDLKLQQYRQLEVRRAQQVA